MMKHGLGDTNPLFNKDAHPWKGTNPKKVHQQCIYSFSLHIETALHFSKQ
jgi:hypothetical protein